MSFPAYPAYKDSGVEWLGEVPEHWVMGSLKNMAQIRNGRDYKEVESSDGEYPVIGSGGQFSNATQYLYEGESVLLGRKGTIDKPLYINGRFWTVDTMFYTEISKGACAKFFYYNSLTIPFGYYSTSTALPSMTQADLLNHPAAIPTKLEQTQISRFLDHETARIDALIEEQQRLIELLKEKRQAVISHAVTKGLDSTVPMKESEISYLDKSPIHWRLKRLGDVVAFAQGKAHEPYIDDDGDFICVNSRFVSTEGKTQKYCSVNLTPASVNDILMVMSDLPNGRALARAYYVIENGRLAVNQRVCRITAEQANSRFLFYLLNRHPGLMQNDDGVNQTHLSNSDFQKLRIFLPPLSEQLKIAHYLDHVTVRIDSLISEAVIGVGLLQERRSALISAAVTGKIDVRGWQPPASTQTPEFEVAEAH